MCGLHHIAEPQRDTRRYINMEHLNYLEDKQQSDICQTAEFFVKNLTLSAFISISILFFALTYTLPISFEIICLKLAIFFIIQNQNISLLSFNRFAFFRRNTRNFIAGDTFLNHSCSRTPINKFTKFIRAWIESILNSLFRQNTYPACNNLSYYIYKSLYLKPFCWRYTITPVIKNRNA